MPSTRLVPRLLSSHEGGSALVITLAFLLLITVLVVSLISVITLERADTHSSFENQRSREFGNMALDEVVATLRDNIPTNTVWAAAPGQLSVYTNGTFTLIPLYSGAAPGTTAGTGQVDLNAPLLSAATNVEQYPIVPINSEYPNQTPMPVAWVDVLADGTQVHSTGGASPTAGNQANPVVGRYAYWVDTETSKVNLNTAGKGQTIYNFNTSTNSSGKTDMSTNDSQNLTGAPSRVDLSELDDSITPAQSVATFHYTYGGYFSGDLMTNLYPWYTSYPPTPMNLPGSMPQGAQRFNSIEEWPMMTNDLFSGALVSPVTAAQVEQNRFYLTTRSRTPEVTPWGFNKFWLQIADSLNANAAGDTTEGLSSSGNKLNGRIYPIYPATNSSFGRIPGQDAPAVGGTSHSHTTLQGPDTRYYVTPVYPYTSATTTLGFQTHSAFIINDNPALISNFINNMMVQLNRTDWPGFSGQSFVAKYGKSECEDLAFDMACLFDNAVDSNGSYPSFIQASTKIQDINGNYGSASMYANVDGKSRLFSGVGEWPYLTQMSASFGPTVLGAFTTNNSGFPSLTGNTADAPSFTNAWSDPCVTQLPTNIVTATLIPVTNSGVVTYTTNYIPYYTKSGVGPGFAPPASTKIIMLTNGQPLPENVAIQMKAQFMYPPGFKNDYLGYPTVTSTPRLVDIAVYATGTYNGKPVTYGSNDTSSAATEGTTYIPASEQALHPYYWGFPDNYYNLTNIVGTTTNVDTNPAQGSGFGPTVGLPTIRHSTTGNAVFETVPFDYPYLFIGPFDAGTTVTDVQIRCRFVNARRALASNTQTVAMQIVPLACNTNSTGLSTDEQTCFTNVMTGAQSTPGGASTAVAPTFLFDGGPITLPSTPPALSTNVVWQTSSQSHYEIIDPRVYRYLNDWSYESGDVTGGNSSTYTSSYVDPLTGSTNDASKLAWPNVATAYLYDENSAGTFDPRVNQFANNIEGFPGIGWLSVLPLNCESSQPNPTGLNPSNPNNGTNSIPWRTLSLGPSLKSNLLPDWLLLEAFAVAYDQTYCSQTDGKINVNLNINPAFPNSSGTPVSLQRLKPFEALLQPNTYSQSSTVSPGDYPSLNATQIAASVASFTGINSGPCGSLPTNIMIYPGQLCQVSGMAGSGTTQWQQESLMRNIAGLVTTQCSDYKVFVVAQAVKQVNFTGNPATDLIPTGEQRMSALVSRETNLGPDNLPDTGMNPLTGARRSTTGDEPPTSYTNIPASSTLAASSGVTNILYVATPPFKYVISQINYDNN